MRKPLRNVLILLFPIFLMVAVNEFSRISLKDQGYKSYGFETINSGGKIEEKCTWVCHNDTKYCKKHHVKYLKPFYALTDLFYFGIIGVLAATGNYGAANILILVLLLPYTILYFIIKSLNLQDEIRKHSK